MLQLGLTVNNSLVAGHGVLHGFIVYFGFFTILSNSFAALVLTAHATGSPAPVWAFFRRAVVVTSATASMLIVGSVYFFVLRRLWHPQGLQLIVDALLHYVMPPLTLVFWWFAVPGGAIAGSGVGKMLSFPLVYLVYVFLRGPIVGSYPYFFIDVTTLGFTRALLNAGGVAVLFLFVLVVMVLANNRRPVSGTDRAGS